MFVALEHFLQEWEHESKGTQQILDALTDESLARAGDPGHRTIGRLAWHIATTIHEMMSRAGLELPSPGDDPNYLPSSAREIAEQYRKSSADLAEAIRKQWTDAVLTETRDMYGETWTVATVLRTLISHEVHHRAQITVLMRLAGLRVPGMYGPALEDWASMGYPAPTV